MMTLPSRSIAFMEMMRTRRGLASVYISIESALINVACRRDVRERLLEIAALDSFQERTYGLVGRGGRSQVARADGGKGHQHDGENNQYNGKYAAHQLASRNAGAVSAGAGNSTVSARRRRSGSSMTSTSASKLLPTGSVPHSRPSHVAGAMCDSIGCAGGISSLLHRVTLPPS